MFGEHKLNSVQLACITRCKQTKFTLNLGRRAMLYTVEAFYNNTGLLAFEERVPEGYDEVLRGIMGWATDQQGWEGYDLTRYQLESLETILGKSIYDPVLLFQMSCSCHA